MRLIIDAGSTKMEWILMEGNEVRSRFTTEGFNPNYGDRRCLEKIINLVKTQFIASPNNDSPVSRRDELASLQAIHYYGTGCGSTLNCQLVKEVFQNHFPVAEIFVTHDLMAACHALFGHEKGIACILGTGSNACAFDGENITEKAVSLGYLVGDEGSGMHIGREVVRTYFYGFMPEDLRQKFDAMYHLEQSEFVNNLYHGDQPSRYLASFAKFAGENQEHPFIHDLAQDCFKKFVESFVCRFDACMSMRIGFVGSVACHFQGILKEVLESFGLRCGPIMASPAEGLVQYYQSED